MTDDQTQLKIKREELITKLLPRKVRDGLDILKKPLAVKFIRLINSNNEVGFYMNNNIPFPYRVSLHLLRSAAILNLEERTQRLMQDWLCYNICLIKTSLEEYKMYAVIIDGTSLEFTVNYSVDRVFKNDEDRLYQLFLDLREKLTEYFKDRCKNNTNISG